MNLVGKTDAELDELVRDAWRLIEDIEDERSMRHSIGPTLWETLTPEEKRSRMTVGERMMADAVEGYKAGLRKELEQHHHILSLLDQPSNPEPH